MKLIKTLAIACTLLMFLALIYGFVFGDFFKEGSVLISLAWGKISLIDVYIGFLLFSGWIVYRENKLIDASVWILFIILFGNFISCLYVTINLFKSNGNIQWFWLGKHNKTKQ